MPRNLLASYRQQELSSGLYPDPYTLVAPFWVAGSNIRFTATGVAKIPGWSSVFAEQDTDPIRGMAQNIGSTQELYFGDQTNLYRYNGTLAKVSKTDNVYTGALNQTVLAPAATWSFAAFGSWMLATNGADPVQIYKTGPDFADLDVDSQFTTAEILMVRGPHVIAMNTNTNNKEVIWCSADDPEDWLATASNSAGSLIVRELESEIMAAAPLGQSVAIYGKDSMHGLSYIGSPFYFGVKPLLNGIGAVSKACVVSKGRLNYGVSLHGFWETDGVSFNYIDDPAVRKYFRDNFNAAQSSKTFGFHDEARNMIIWGIPTSTGEPDTLLGFNYLQRTWTFISHSSLATAGLERQHYSEGWVANKDGQVFSWGVTHNADGSAMTAYVRTKALDLGAPDFIKDIEAIRIGYVGTGLRFRVGWSETTDGTITWGDYTENPDGHEFSPLRMTGRYFHIELQSQDTGDYWEVGAIDFYGKVRMATR